MEKLLETLISSGELIHKGAEANIYLVNYFGEKYVMKIRFRKKYRDPSIDKVIIRGRTFREAYVLRLAEKIGIPSPKLIYASLRDGALIMSYISGSLLKDLLLRRILKRSEKKRVFEAIGRYIAILHNNGVTHGDLTTSNILISRDKSLFFIDYGLANLTASYEDKSVDIEMFERVLISTHTDEASELFNWFLNGYVDYVDDPDEILRRYEVIKRSGRYYV